MRTPISKYVEYFSYDPETGLFTWRSIAGKPDSLNRQRHGKPAFTTQDKDGYLVTRLRKPGNKFITIRAHRMAWAIMTGREPRNIDHINHDRKDNRWSNLREASGEQNRRNTTKNHGSSRYQGVHFHQKTGKWRAMIRVDGKAKHVGLFETEKEAAKARDEAAKKVYGTFANLNFTAHRQAPS